nr:ras-related protein Rab-4B [Pelodiscus sinensis]|eukprot:XP_025040854.1 ras-related protein Rab-4B [Pelodiscus sinensis]
MRHTPGNPSVRSALERAESVSPTVPSPICSTATTRFRWTKGEGRVSFTGAQRESVTCKEHLVQVPEEGLRSCFLSPLTQNTPPQVLHVWCFCSPDFLFKFLVIGSAGTGKSCLLHQFIESKFKQDSNHTIGVEFGSKVVNVGGKTVKLQIWDTAGQERFRSVTRSYYRGAAGALLVYDITRWVPGQLPQAGPGCGGVQGSLAGGSGQSGARGRARLLRSLNLQPQPGGELPAAALAPAELMFLETSALTGENVEEAFLKCARNILNKIESGELDPERMGSGIQYGDTSLRHLKQPHGAQAQSKPPCSC